MNLTVFIAILIIIALLIGGVLSVVYVINSGKEIKKMQETIDKLNEK